MSNENQHDTINELLTEKELLELFGIKKESLDYLRREKHLPFLKVGTTTRLYHQRSVMKWLIARETILNRAQMSFLVLSARGCPGLLRMTNFWFLQEASTDAGSADAVEDEIVIFHSVAGRRHGGEAPGAALDLEDTVAPPAVEVMVVAAPGGLIAVGRTRQLDHP